ncbi:MAG: PIN domain-containing protein [Lachnospiraceae bacterium]|nr:PIN domain-containing protein [Lachnospiraceae bacterium]
MKYISSDTNVWLDFEMIDRLELPFKLPYSYLMNEDAVHDELLSPEGLSERLLALGLVETELKEEEFFLTETYSGYFPKLSVYDCVVLTMEKYQGIALITGDDPLRKATQAE